VRDTCPEPDPVEDHAQPPQIEANRKPGKGRPKGRPMHWADGHTRAHHWLNEHDERARAILRSQGNNGLSTLVRGVTA